MRKHPARYAHALLRGARGRPSLSAYIRATRAPSGEVSLGIYFQRLAVRNELSCHLYEATGDPYVKQQILYDIVTMNAGICVCILLAALSGSIMGRPSHLQDKGKASVSPQHTRHTRSVPHTSQIITFSKPAEEEADPRTSLSELLARLISRKGSYQKNVSLKNRASGPSPSHRIKDRDYLGWMDFGRRSAEEYEEYSS
ncbi:hypothetical protein DPEC_G00140670 [Dallia pectoralis]|uniref:Uncharacterized protein n=1 Tax=Dallia pectoralis TaxID=75939 RepID=A0ACC2GMA2_DALPE|nr:hypothetical protein DPEC_G00140670 [Dallia pectoralis]